MYFLDLSWLEECLRLLMAALCQLIYPFIGWLFNLFMNVAKVNIFSGEVKPIYQRVTLILTIIMVFYVTFEFVKFVVQPDGITDKEKGVGHIVTRMVLVVVLIAFVPTIFDWSYKLQSAVIDKGIIGKVILGNTQSDPSKFGSTFAASTFGLFYNVAPEDEGEDCDGIKCGTLVQMNLGQLANHGELTYLTLGLNETKDVPTKVEGEETERAIINFQFNGLFAVIVGCFMVFILVLYCIDVGVRWAQLIFLQVIAPIPIIGYLSPKKDGIFQKWCKQCLTTYLDLFIRIAIMYFILLICSILLEGRTSGELLKGLNVDSTMATFIYIVLILGLLLFAKKAPELLKELFPKSSAASGNFGLKPGERMPALAARAAGLALGAGLGATRAAGSALARGVNAYRRNRANGKAPLWTKRGLQETFGKEARDARKQNRENYQNARRELRDARRRHNKMDGSITSEELTKKQDAFNNARDARAKMKNESYRSVVGQSLWGATSGALQGAWHGGKSGIGATKLEDIGKKVSAGYKEAAKHTRETIQENEKYLNAGGSGGITGWVDKKLTQAQQDIGMTTRADVLDAEIKSYEQQITAEKQQASVESSVLTTLDSAVSANQSKIESGKHKGTIATASSAGVSSLATKLGMSTEAVAGQKLSDVSAILMQNALDAKTKADELGKQALADPENSDLQERAKAARAAQVKAERMQKDGIKALSEYENTRILQAMQEERRLGTPQAITINPDNGFEQGAVTSVASSIQRLKEAYAQPDTRSKVLEILRQTKTEADYDLYSRCFADPDQISDNDVLDGLSKVLKSVSSRRESEVQERENAKNRLASGEYKAEVSANVSSSGSGKK